jgi:peptide/nickel transport system permease protein
LARYILTRLLGLLGTLLVLSVLVFILMHSIPGGPFDLEGGDKGVSVPEAIRKEILKNAGLDKPLPEQYGIYLWNALHLDFGYSFARPTETVTELIGRTWKISAQLGIATFLMALMIGVTLGIWAAIHQNTWVDYVTTTLSVTGTVFPNFVVAIVLVMLFGVLLRWLPTSGWGGPRFWVLPVVAYSLLPMSMIARFTRSSMIEILGEDYVRTARAKGLIERLVVVRHVFRNALIPIVTILGPIFADVMTGSFYIETIFRIPGLGKFFTSSALGRDYPMIMGTTLLMAGMFALVNLITDLLYVAINPRIRLGSSNQ